MENASYERFMNLCRYEKIGLWNIKQQESLFTFSIKNRDFKRLKEIAKKTHAVPRIQSKHGAPFLLLSMKKNWTFIAAIVACLLLMWYYSGFIWEINVQGQNKYSKQTLLECVQMMGIYPGMRKSNLNCDNIETLLRKKFDGLSWVSAEEVGSKLVIKVKEGAPTIKTSKDEKPRHIVASCDGKIVKIVTSKGVPLVKKNDLVKKGDILISGVTEIKNDQSEVVNKIPVCAKGTIYLDTSIQWKKTYPKVSTVRAYQKGERVAYVIRAGEKELILKNPLKQFDKSIKYGIITKVCYKNQNYFFGIDFLIYKKIYRPFKMVKSTNHIKGIKKQAISDFHNYLLSIKSKGSKILSKRATLIPQKDKWLLEATVQVIMPQATVREVHKEEWSVEHGKDDRDTS